MIRTNLTTWLGRVLPLLAVVNLCGCQSPAARGPQQWNQAHSAALAVSPIEFHCAHGVFAGSYPTGVETVTVGYRDVCTQLGHVCLCGAGGFRIAGEAVAALRGEGPPLEREEFILISGRDHTVSDVIASVLGCVRRADPQRSRYFIDDSIVAPRREYHYYIAYRPARRAVHVIYRKHLLIGHEEMDVLWRIEQTFDTDPDALSTADIERYRRAMQQMVRDVLLDRVPGLITVEPVDYATFESRLETCITANH
ncbi:MAG: hypothetical protein PVJ57_18975 [Phycisphaerae bacterium]|jgi:hypothetical protein